MVSPGEFIPFAEETGLIIPIGQWVLKQACLQLKRWQMRKLPEFRISINLSPLQFRQQDLVNWIERVLGETQVESRYLELEITENAIADDMEQARRVLQALKSRGIGLAIDDFGTGYSSLNYLMRFPINRLKIDQLFIKNMILDPDNAAIVLSVIGLARSLHLQVTAEGVETESQWAFLKAECCDEIQGYYFSRPLTAAAMTDLLCKNPSLVLAPSEDGCKPLDCCSTDIKC